jgi:hypothetical protein
MSDDSQMSEREAFEEQLLGFLVAGWTHDDAAHALGVSTKSVQRRVGDRVFAAKLGQRRAVKASALTSRLDSITDRAVDVIVESFESEVPAVRLRAADLALSWSARMRRELDLEARVARLEQVDVPDGGGVGSGVMG